MNRPLIYGKDLTERVVSVEVSDGTAEVFIEHADGRIEGKVMPHEYWILFSDELSPKFVRLDGDLYYKYLISYPSYEKYREIVSSSYKKRREFYTSHDPKTNFMLRSGVTYYKGMKVEDVSVLSFDIETTGLNPDATDAQVLLISNTFRKAGQLTRRLFCVDDYETDTDMIFDWCEWVGDINPSLLIGHYILGFDLPYLKSRAGRLPLGRDGSDLRISDKVRQFRKDGSQTYDYQDIFVYGREIVDTKFLSIKHDVKREFPNYSLKPIIAHLGLEKKNRTFVDASRMKELWKNPKMRQTIKDYAIDDSDDPIKLFDKMIPAFFYFAQNIPMSIQQINNTASGTQINNFLIRSYLQDGHSIPKASPKAPFEGAISLGFPGVHKNTFKVDVSGMYPSIMLQYGISPGVKDPKGHFLEMLEFFSNERLKNKQLAKETGDAHFENLSNSGKIIVNSAYGFMGAEGANFNNPEGAAEVTRIGRDILRCAMYWATGKEIHGGISETSESDELYSA